MAHIQPVIKVAAVVLAGRACGNASNKAILAVHAHTEFVSIVAFTVLLVNVASVSFGLLLASFQLGDWPSCNLLRSSVLMC